MRQVGSVVILNFSANCNDSGTCPNVSRLSTGRDSLDRGPWLEGQPGLTLKVWGSRPKTGGLAPQKESQGSSGLDLDQPYLFQIILYICVCVYNIIYPNST